MSYVTCPPVAHSAGNPLFELHAALTRRLGQRKVRRKLRRMLDHEDYVLDDMGVARTDIDWVLSLPLSIDAAQELQRLSVNRRKARM